MDAQTAGDNGRLRQQLEALVDKHGFECRGHTTADRLEVLDEVRNMCASNMCHSYNRNWACPPAVGPIEDFRQRIAALGDVVVFQSVAQMDDEFDIDTMMDTEDLHKERFEAFCDEARQIAPDALYLGAGTCTLCDECTCPDEPCRFPNRRFVSMEAAGLVVSDVCKSTDIPYHHSDTTIAYISCVVF